SLACLYRSNWRVLAASWLRDRCTCDSTAMLNAMRCAVGHIQLGLWPRESRPVCPVPWRRWHCGCA
ncbi:hypothetical protein CTI14_58470, partial [Methylobacterium radiotolerans]